MVIVSFVLYTNFSVFQIHKAFKLSYDTGWPIRGLKMNKSKFGVLSIIALFVLSLSVGLVAAQYTTQKTTDLNIASDGTCSVYDADVGIAYLVQGTPGASGSITAAVYNGNPQPSASIPSGVSLNHFVVVTFDMAASDFIQATITLNYVDSDVQNIQEPYAVYKYLPATDSYVALSSTVDTVAKTITITLNSVDDSLFAIGGAVVSDAPVTLVAWAIVVVSVIVIVLLSVLIVAYLKRSFKS
jgi:hypothetical protein